MNLNHLIRKDKMNFDSIPEKQIISLKNKPWWTDKHDLLQKYVEDLGFHNSHIVAFPDETSVDIIDIIVEEKIQPITVTEILKIKCRIGDCHNNCFRLLQADKIDTIFTGYALSDDGLWRNHSWGLKKDFLIETTEERLVYLGIQLKITT